MKETANTKTENGEADQEIWTRLHKYNNGK